MQRKFATPAALQEDGVTYDIGSPTVSALLENAKWDYVVMNDHTQSPAREETSRTIPTNDSRCYSGLYSHGCLSKAC